MAAFLAGKSTNIFTPIEWPLLAESGPKPTSAKDQKPKNLEACFVMGGPSEAEAS